jgi:Zn-dependent membrane protease YugP
MMMFDPVYFLFVGPAMLLSLWAGMRVKRTFARYSRMPTSGGRTGAQAARLLLDTAGLHDVKVRETTGMLTDHYHPTKRELALSRDVYRSPSVAAVGVACHEAGHALQHQKGYFPLYLRSLLVPVASFGSRIWIWLLMAGVFLNFMGLVKVGIILFAGIVAFQLVTLPVEFDASARAKRLMREHALVSGPEADGAAKVLNAAALTYVAAALTSVLTLLYWLYRSGLLGGRR